MTTIDADPSLHLAGALGIDVRHARALTRAGVRDLEAMASWTTDDVADIQGVGPMATRVLTDAIRAAGIPLPDAPRMTAHERLEARRAASRARGGAGRG